MTEKHISFAGQTLTISFPQQAAAIMDFTFRDFPEGAASTTCRPIAVSYDPQKRLFSVTEDGQQIGADLAPAELSLLLLSRSTYSLIHNIHGGLAIHGAAIQHNNKAVLMPGKSGTGKSILTSWLLSRGYNYLTDELVYFPEERDYFTALSRPIHIKESGRHIVEGFVKLPNQQNGYLQSDKTTLLSHTLFDDAPVPSHPELAFLLFIEQNDNSALAINSISPAQAAKRLMESLVNARNLQLPSFSKIASLTRKTPSLVLQYGNIEQLNNILEPIIDFVLNTQCNPSSFQKFIGAFQALNAQQPIAETPTNKITPVFPIPKATKKGKKRKLTIGMATYDDYDGVYFSVQALQMYHPEIAKECEILVIDNHPDGPCAESLKNLDKYVDGYRYVPLQDTQGTAVRDHIFLHATSDYVVCMDCHVFIVPGAIKKLLNYFEMNPDCQDLLQGPMLYDDLTTCVTHLEPIWRGGMYGTWATDSRGKTPEGAPFEIPMQGLGLFACRKDAWQRFNPHFRGFGGEEGYIHEKFRQAGGRTLCLPFLRWMHRFARPMGVPYPLQWEDRIWNYWIGHIELNLDINPMKEHFRDLLGKENAQSIFAQIEEEVASPFSFFEAIYCITLSTHSERWKKILPRFHALGISKQVRIFKAIETTENHHIGCALSHRAIILSAKQQHLKNVLIFEDDAIFLDETLHHLTKSIAELKNQSWNLFYLGGHRWGKEFEHADDCLSLQKPSGVTCTHALAYNHTIYDQILQDLPDSIAKMTTWVQSNLAIDQYLRTLDGALLASPTVASQTELLPQEQEKYRSRFTLGSEPNERTDTLQSNSSIHHGVSGKNQYARRDAMGNFYFLCPQKKFMFISISKNGCTSLKHLLFIEEYKKDYISSPGRGIHNIWGYQEQTGRIIDRKNKTMLKKHPDYLRFVVYREPVERFMSTFHNKVLYPPHPHIFYTTHNLTGISLDEFIKKVEIILSIPDPMLIDEHLRKQSDFFSPEDVDHIVPLNNLEHFVINVLNCNKLPHDNQVIGKKIQPDKRQIEQIRSLYAADYQICPTYTLSDT